MACEQQIGKTRGGAAERHINGEETLPNDHFSRHRAIAIVKCRKSHHQQPAVFALGALNICDFLPQKCDSLDSRRDQRTTVPRVTTTKAGRD